MKDPAFLFYTSDFLTGTLLMSNEQIGIYIKLLCIQHQHNGIIKKKDFTAMVKDDDAIALKFIQTEEGFYNERLRLEMEKRKEKSQKLSLNAYKRWRKQGICKSNAIASDLHMPIEDEDEDVNEDININKDKRGMQGGEKKEENKSFNIFWEAYPRKKSKGQAEKSWSRIKPDKNLIDIILNKIRIAKDSEDWTKENGQYIPYPATWLNAKGWEDEYIKHDNRISDKAKKSIVAMQSWLQKSEAKENGE